MVVGGLNAKVEERVRERGEKWILNAATTI
jgi:hypothetical protein